MKTDELISALAADDTPPASTGRRLAAGIAVGAAVAAAAFFLTLGFREDIARAIGTWRFDLKIALVFVAAVAALVDCWRLSRPTANAGTGPLTVLVAVALAAAVVVELWSVPSTEWRARLLGTNAALCLMVIPMLAAVPLVAILWSMRSGAPRSPANAGRAAGTLAATVAALLYATHCFDDSPLFVATWYTLAIAIVSVAGMAIGARILKW